MPCIGDTDSRYNRDVSYDLKEQENFWNSLEGLFLEDMVFYNSDGIPLTNYSETGFPAQLGTYDFSNVKGFLVRRRDIHLLFYAVNFLSNSSSNVSYFCFRM
jgi:hypothetical protein